MFVESIAIDVSGMDAILLTIVKYPNARPFEHAQSMSKWPTGLANIGSFINNLLYLPDCFPRGLQIDLEWISTFIPLTLLIHIYTLGLVTHCYGSLFICITTCLGSWASSTALCIEVG